MNGIEMMLKSMGVDPEQLKKQFTEFQDHVKTLLGNIDGRLQRIEAAQKEQALNVSVSKSTEMLLTEMKLATEMLLTEMKFAILFLEELTAWKRQQQFPALMLETQLPKVPSPQPTAQLAPNPQQAEHS